MSLRLISLILFALAVINFNLWRDERNARQLLEQELAREDARASLSPSLLPEREVDMGAPPVAKETTDDKLAAVRDAGSPLSEAAQYGIESRISAIGKFVPLNDEQRSRLKEKYSREAIARRNNLPADAESLESIIGESSAEFYKQQLSTAFEKSQQQELDREVFYLSRKLAFTESQENALRDLLARVDTEVGRQFQHEKNSPEYSSDPAYRVRLVMKENQFRSEWLAKELKAVLSEEQYQAYLQEEAESSNAELGMWHAP